MGHKTLIGGTAYEIKGGKTLIGGTAYDIKGGKTLIGGTGYNITFAPPREQTIEALMSQAVLITSAGRDSSSTATVNTYVDDAGTYYAICGRGPYVSINKVVFDGNTAAKTVLYQTSSSYGNVNATVESGRLKIYSAAAIRGSGIYVFQFSGGYTEQEIDAIFVALTYANWASAYGSSRSEVYKNSSFGTGYMLVCYKEYIAFNRVSGSSCVNIYGNYSTYPKLIAWLHPSGSTSWTYWHFSLDGSSRSKAYACTMHKVTEEV